MKNNKGLTVPVGARNAFTLAEVLIVITIIGVIAAMTIPSLMTSTRGEEYKTAAKKALATFSQAMTMRATLSGGEDLEDFLRGDRAPTAAEMRDYLIVATDNGIALAGATCNGTVCKLKDGSIVSFNGATITVDTNGEKGPTRSRDNAAPVAAGGTATNPTPDVVTFNVRTADNAVEPADQRTRNILTTGDATQAN